jgi:Sulfite reductase, alpha subunit (flavoprotein)
MRWRYIHLILAIIASLFFVLASLTGIIIGINNIDRQYPSYKIDNLRRITLAQSVAGIKDAYLEVNTLSFDPRGFASIKATNLKGEEVNAHIDPLTGKILGKIENKSSFIKRIISLHRSLELKNIGRMVMGIVAFFLLLSAFSGLMLVFQKQKGIRNFFKRTIKWNFSQYYHTVFGKWLLIPILILGLTGTYLVYNRFFIQKEEVKHSVDTSEEEFYDGGEPMEVRKIAVFNQITLNQVVSVEFPFDTTPEDTYLIKLKDRELIVSQFTGNILSEIKYPKAQLLASFFKDLHTGRTSAWWAAILVLSCIGILFFIYTGFAITLRKKSVKFHNLYTFQEAEYIILYGSEGGNTLFLAQKVFSQLISLEKKAYLAPLNHYQEYSQATHLLVFTSTYGVGNAPSNADKFLPKARMISQKELFFSVVGFGSDIYPDFCQFAKEVQQILQEQSWAKELLPLHTVNNQSVEEFLKWVTDWNATTGILLDTLTTFYQAEEPILHKVKVLEKSDLSLEEEGTFSLRLYSPEKYTSGDLLAIYPDGKKERLYSIGKVAGKIQLTVKLHPYGLGSNYLYNLQKGENIQARIVPNPSFHFPKKIKNRTIILVANGTGIAPYLGMIEENKHTSIHLYVGFRYNDEAVAYYRDFFEKQVQKGKLKEYHFIYSREEEGGYVTDLLKKNAEFVRAALEKEGIIMICGSMNMYKDVIQWIDTLTEFSSEYYKANKQLLADCY